VAVTDLLRRLSALLGSLLAVGGARALDLPADSAEAMFHSYNGGGVSANGPALHGQPSSAMVTIPANGVLVFARA